MLTFMEIIYYLGFVVAIVAIVWLIINLIKKKRFKAPLITLIVGVLCIVIGYVGFGIATDQALNSIESNQSSETTSSTVTKSAFGKSQVLTNGNQKVSMTVTSVQAVGSDDLMVTDVSHNYDGLKKYVIVNYKVKALSNNVNLDQFDGSELKVLDSKKESGVMSSNRDSGTPDKLSKGETANLRIGVGFHHNGDTATVGMGNEEWTGTVN